MINLTGLFGVRDIPVSMPLQNQFPTAVLCAQKAAMLHEGLWKGYASGAPLPDGRHMTPRTGQYLRSIGTRQIGAFTWRVESTLPYAATLEEGAPQYDMKQWLRTSAKAKVGKDGKRYLVVPFQHGTPGAKGMRSVMPKAVHTLAKALKATQVTSVMQVPNQIGLHNMATRQMVEVARRSYTYGERLGKEHGHFAGMVRMDTSTGNKTSSSYLTFRVMSENSRGWIRPARAGYYPNQAAETQVRPNFDKAFAQCLKADIEAWKRVAGVA